VLKTLESIEGFSRVGLDEIGARVWMPSMKRKSRRTRRARPTPVWIPEPG